MKFPFSLLRKYLETNADASAVAERLVQIGHEVEALEKTGGGWENMVVGRVVSAVRHPNADRLWSCRVTIDPEYAAGKADHDPDVDTISVVCGAPNVKVGMLAAYAPVGTVIPATGKKLKRSKIRGIDSCGMLCSEMELGLGNDHDGIIHLSGDALVGDSLANWLSVDPVFDVAITPNRGDCLSVYGIARDLAAAGLGSLKSLPQSDIVSSFVAPIDITLEFSQEDIAQSGSGLRPCEFFAARYIRGVQNRASPAWMQKFLVDAGMRPIDALVDVTNYITLTLGRPLHAYDADKLTGSVIGARMAHEGESFEALDNRIYRLNSTNCVIADASGVLGLGGIIGGAATGCGPDTKNVLLESAWFDPVVTARTGRTQKCNTDARYRFERGIDPALVVRGLDIATALICEICGGEVSELVSCGEAPIRKRTVEYRIGAVQRVAGMDVGESRISSIFSDLGLNVAHRIEVEPDGSLDEVSRNNGVRLVVDIPSWRGDIECEEDLVEEIVRIIGLDELKEQPLAPTSSSGRVGFPPLEQCGHQVRDVLAARGMYEAVTYSFIDLAEAKTFDGGDSDLNLVNPIASNMVAMRPSLLPGLLASIRRNVSRGQSGVALFEVGNVFSSRFTDRQKLMVAGVRFDDASTVGSGRHWRDKPHEVDAFDAKADVWAMLEALNVNFRKVGVDREVPHYFHPGCSGRVVSGRGRGLSPVGTFGVIHPLVAREFGIKRHVVGFELDIGAILGIESLRKDSTLSDIPTLSRDFSFIVPVDIEAGDVVSAVHKSGAPEIEKVTVFDVWTGGDLETQGQKSVAISVEIQPEITLSEEEIRSIYSKVDVSVRKLGAILRDGDGDALPAR